MYEEIAICGLALWLGLPAWIANSMPVIFGGGRPIDNGCVFRDGRRLFGDSKTIRGFISGVFFGTVTAILLQLSAPYVQMVMAEHLTITNEMKIILGMDGFTGFLASVGALTGDLVGSFLKRRIDLQSGGPAPMLDQLGFILMALIFMAPLLQPAPVYAGILILLTLVIHWVSNIAGYLLRLKSNPW